MIGWTLVCVGTFIGLTCCGIAVAHIAGKFRQEKKDMEIRDRLFATWLTACDLRKGEA